MRWTVWIRQTHRWTSAVFLATVAVATYAAISGQPQDSTLFYLPLAPLFLLMATGLFMFVRPFVAKRRIEPGEV